VVEANAAGEVRGFLKNVPIPIEKTVGRTSILSPFFGAGFLSVTRTLADAKQPFTGRVMMAHGSLAKDLAHYYLTSEQIPTSFSLSVNFDSQGRCDRRQAACSCRPCQTPKDAIVRQDRSTW
jgi:molecular chaperone Hsp33